MKLFRILVVLSCISMAVSPAFAQGGGSRSPLSGRVMDEQGAAIPGASVQIKDEASGATFDTVTTRTCTERYRVGLISPSVARSHPDNNVQHFARDHARARNHIPEL